MSSDATKAELIEYGRHIVEDEISALGLTRELIGESFAEAVQLILSLPDSGRVVVAGMGKASYVAMKISATLASTGTRSFFLHPAEAVHGDLGRFSPDDIVLILSNSGDTAEITNMLRPIKRMGCPLISITGKPESTLAEFSSVVLSLGDISEAGPLGLAPTSSAIAMLALGDALAMTIVKSRNFTKQEFARFHPGGSLGRQLLLVSEIMRSDDKHAVIPDTTSAREVLHVITCTRGRPGAAALVNSDGVLSGVFTDGDLRRCLEKDESFLDKPISEVMGKSPKTIHPEQMALEALKVISEHKIDQLIVVDANRRPIGLIDVQDLMDIRV